jgi:hypothetical protein
MTRSARQATNIALCGGFGLSNSPPGHYAQAPPVMIGDLCAFFLSAQKQEALTLWHGPGKCRTAVDPQAPPRSSEDTYIRTFNCFKC